MDNKIQMVNVERLQALETWIKTTHTKITQVKGQRKYGGPPEVWDGPLPGLNCEVFISHIPRDTYEDLLIPLFSSVGPLWEFRLMMNFSGQNRGFAYAKYGSAKVAKHAIRCLNGSMLAPGVRIFVCPSSEKRKLYLTPLSTTIREDDLLQELRKMVEGVESLSLMSGPETMTVSAVVVFSTHYMASIAKKTLGQAFLKRFGVCISIQWKCREKVNDELHLPEKYESFPASTPKFSELAQHMAEISQMPHRAPQSPSFISAAFWGAVGEPVVPKSATCPPTAALSVSPVIFLQNCCAVSGLGLPQFEFIYSYAQPDEVYHFDYKVRVPGLGVFPGQIMILPGPNDTATLERAREAAAQQLLQSVIGLKVFIR
ncbi:dead end protein 1 isoform 1-T1 [Syngnathus typhle]